MRILTVVQNLGPGGTQRSAQTHAQAYQDAGAGSAVLAYEQGGPRLDELREQNIDAFVAEPHQPERALEAAIAWKPDAVHIHRQGFANPATDTILAALRDAGVRAVIETNHFARADRSPGRDRIDVHIQLSKWCLWQWRRRCRGLHPAPIGIAIPHIIRADRFGIQSPEARARWREEHGIPRDAVLFGRIGQPNRPSWSPLLFDAFDRVARDNENARLVTVGLPPSLRPTLDALPDPISRRIVTIDFLRGDAALRACYGSLDVFAHASNCGETFGMVICEAALARVPTVTLSTPARANSQVEVVGHERGGLVAGNPKAFIEAMCRLADQPETRRRFGENAAAWVTEHCDPSRITHAILGVFEDILRSDNREQLSRTLRDRGDITTHAAAGELTSLLSSIPGSNPLRDRGLMLLSTQQWLASVRWALSRRSPPRAG